MIELNDKVESQLEFLIKVRRDLHKIPEESGKEVKTPEYIISTLKELGLKPKRVLNGVVCDIKSSRVGAKTIVFRADFDGLSLTEKTNVSYASKNGFMHACGHDGHTAIALALAKMLKDNAPQNNVRIVFQFGEEGDGGAEKMIAEGILSGADEAYAFHVCPELESGKLACSPGAIFAGTVEFNIEFKGEATHCANKNGNRNALDSLSHFMANANLITASSKNNLLFHIGKVWGGAGRNIVAASATALCTLRYFDENQKEEALMKIAKILTESDTLFKTSHVLTCTSIYPPLINSGLAFSNLLAAEPNVEECLPRFTAEDFAFFSQIPSCMCWLGTKTEEFSSPLHSDTFGLDEKSLLYGLEIIFRVVNASR